MRNKPKKNVEKAISALICVTVSEVAGIYLEDIGGIHKEITVPAIAAMLAGIYNYLKHKFF